MAFTFNGVTKIISTDTAPTGSPAVQTLDAEEMYSRWKDWILLSDNSKYDPALRFEGKGDIGSGNFIDVYIFLMNGWRFQPYTLDHTLTMTGNLKVSEIVGEDTGGSPFVYPSGVDIHCETEFSSSAIQVGGSALTELRFKQLMFKKVNTIVGGKITKMRVNDEFDINITYDAGGIPEIEDWT